MGKGSIRLGIPRVRIRVFRSDGLCSPASALYMLILLSSKSKTSTRRPDTGGTYSAKEQHTNKSSSLSRRGTPQCTTETASSSPASRRSGPSTTSTKW